MTTYVVTLDIRVVLLDTVIQYRHNDVLAGVTSLPGWQYVHIHAVTTILNTQKLVLLRLQPHGAFAQKSSHCTIYYTSMAT